MNTLRCPNIHVIACDLDDSLVATQEHAEPIRRVSDQALQQLGSLVMGLRDHSPGRVYFGSATGRTFSSIQELAAQRPAFNEIFHMMDFHIASVGAAIYARDDAAAGFVRLPNWPGSQSWDRTALLNRFSALPHLELQEPQAQDAYKISYTARSTQNAAEQATNLGSHLDETGLQAHIVVSGSGPWQFVDVLPMGVDKGSALLQLPRLLEDDLPQNDLICRVAAGDSMNDAALLAAADVSIMPGNAQPDLLEWAKSQQPCDALYLADRSFAAGVLQGLQLHIYGD